MPGAVSYLDFDLLIRRTESGYRAQVLSSPAGEATADFAAPFSELELENFLLRVGRPRRGTRRIGSDQEKAAKDLGKRLYDSVFSGDLRTCWSSSLSEADRKAKGLRLRLRIADAPGLNDVPWEYLYNPGLNQFLALSEYTPLIRYIDLPQRIHPLTVDRRLEILVMISSPTDYPGLDVEDEWSRLNEALAEPVGSGQVRLVRLPEARLSMLQRELVRDQYHVLHFVGHAGFDHQTQDGMLVLREPSGMGRLVPGQHLGTILHDHRSLRLVVLNACEGARTSPTDPFSGVAQTLVRCGIPAVIAMQFEITDQAAITFADWFYTAVANGYPVDAALAVARKMIFTDGNDIEWGTPVLYLRAPDGQLFSIDRDPLAEQRVEAARRAAAEAEAARRVTEEERDAEAARQEHRAEAATRAEEEKQRAEVTRQRQRRKWARWGKIAAMTVAIFFVGISGVVTYWHIQSQTRVEAARQGELQQQQAEAARQAELRKQLAEAALRAEVQRQSSSDRPPVGAVFDEAQRGGRAARSFPAADEDYFQGMDNGIKLTSAEIKGRNMWIVWTGGNDRLWDKLTNLTFGAFDLLKTLSSHRLLKFSRDSRWHYLGLVNEPCFMRATRPNPQRYGLYLDVREPDCPLDPFENAQKYPGVAIGARGKNIPTGSFYGYPTGVVGLRLFPNPDFDEAAAAKWDPERFYIDPSYYLSKDLVRPYRVGVSCGFCHVGPNPEKPPANPEAPQWENLSSTVGAQYFWADRIFAWDTDPSSFFFQTLHTWRPGSLDTSFTSSDDNINNPRTMNAVYNLWPRLEVARRWGQETLAPDNAANKQFNDFINQGPLTQFFQPPNTVLTPHVLNDGADSVGALGALNRFYLNIGLFSEESFRHSNPILGGDPVTPIGLGTARANSSYWQATETQTPNMAAFLVTASYPHKLKNAPGGNAYLSDRPDVVQQGKDVFADNCAACHSSKAPPQPVAANPASCIGAGYLNCWNRYWEWTQTSDFKQQMRQIVSADDFLDGNYLSNDMRVPVTLLQTNACSPLATNAIAGNIWDNFSSASYKDLPSVGAITVYNPFTGAPQQYQMPPGGRGYTRVPSLVSVWSTAPFLLNNTVGRFNPSPSVEARMGSFDDAITKLLWPEKRERDPILGDKIPGVIDRTTETSWLRIPIGFLPSVLKSSREVLELIAPKLFGEGGIEIGPIPAGTPVDLLASLERLPQNASASERLAHDKAVVKAVSTLVHDFKALPQGATYAQAWQVFAKDGEQLFALSKCPDYVVNRGHYFGSQLSDSDKKALIAFLKTF